MKNTVQHIRLTNGNEILAVVSEITTDTIKLSEPMLIDELKNIETGQTSMVLAKYMLSKENVVTINKSVIVTLGPVHKEIERYYNNSVIYNKGFVEEGKLRDIEKVNQLLEKIIESKDTERNLELSEEMQNVYIFPVSNTVN